MWPFKRKKEGVRPLGRVQNDGLVQLAFTLPVAPDERACEAARQLGEKMGLTDIEVATMESTQTGFSHFVLYGHSKATIDLSRIPVPVRKTPPLLSRAEIDQLVQEKLGRPIVVVGCALNDRYSIGVGAILSAQGLRGEAGFERYKAFRTYTLRRGDLDMLAGLSRDFKADAVLIATPAAFLKDAAKTARDFASRIQKDPKWAAKPLLIAVDNTLPAKDLTAMGYAAAFSPETSPVEIANCIARHAVTHLASPAS